jgi:regulator of sigma E protease
MSKSKSSLGKNLRGLLWILIFGAIVYLIVRNIYVFGNVLVVLLGFGMVVLVHEFGHFMVAKLSDIHVEAFSIFMPPILLGLRRTEAGLRFRILPKFFPKDNDEAGEGQLCFTVGKKGRAGETEYRIGLIPFGGFVKLLGQDDTSPAKAGDDPRSFSNKPVSTRVPVIAAGVIFNVVSAVIIFMIVFLIGIKLPPPVVGAVVPNSPAAKAGLKPGDEIIKIAGKSKDLDFSNILIAAALSNQGQEVALRVRHENGSEDDFNLVAERLPGEQLRDFGIFPAMTLTVAEVSDPNALPGKPRLLPGDRIKAANGKSVQTHWELAEIVGNTFAPEVTLLVERTNKDKSLKLVESKIRLELISPRKGHIYSMLPRFRMQNIKIRKSPWMKIAAKTRQLLERIGFKGQVMEKPFLQSGDVILNVGEVACPTGEEFLDTVKKYKDNELPIKVLRTDANGVEREHTISVRLKRDRNLNEARIGIEFLSDSDFKHPVVANTIAVENGPAKLEIPRGAVITAVGGRTVSDFYDIITEIKQNAGKPVTIDYSFDGKPGTVTLDAGIGKEYITVKSDFAEFIPFNRMERLYQASGPIDAIAMGYRRTVMFIAQAYVTLKRLVGGAVSPKHLMGPVGIIAVSYHIVAEQPLIDYVYLLGLISAVIAVFNLVPLPPLDGGLILLMLVEKVKGSALSERTQGVIAYAGWALIGTFLLYVTFNDIVRNFFSG